MPTISVLDGNNAPQTVNTLPAVGSAASAASLPVVIASDQGTVPVSAQGNIAAGVTDAGNPVAVGGIANNAAPTAVATGQRVKAWFSLNGAQASFLASASGVPFTAGNPSNDGVNAATSFVLFTSTFSYNWNGGSWDRQRKSNTYARIISSAAAGNPAFLKASPGDVKQFWGVNTSASIVYLQIYNKTTAPVLGTNTPVLTYPIPASVVFSECLPGDGGAYMSTGIAYAFTSDVAGATGVAAATITAFNILAA